METSTNFKDIVNHFNVITSVSSENNYLFVLGLIDRELNTLRVEYKHIEVLKEVKNKVQMFIGIKG